MREIHHSSISKPIYDKIKSMILKNELKPGQKIVQEKIAAELGVSRTPLNRALHMLEFEMLIESVPRKGMYVKEIDLQEMLDVFDCREGIDAVAARLTAIKGDSSTAVNLQKIFDPFVHLKDKIPVMPYRIADQKFHNELINMSGNQILKRLFFIDNLSSKIFQIGLVRPPEETITEHLKIIEAIRRKEPDKAAYEATMHIRKSRELIAASLNDIKHFQLAK